MKKTFVRLISWVLVISILVPLLSVAADTGETDAPVITQELTESLVVTEATEPTVETGVTSETEATEAAEPAVETDTTEETDAMEPRLDDGDYKVDIESSFSRFTIASCIASSAKSFEAN